MILNDRDLDILSWLVHMKFMLLDQIARAFFKDCNPNRACYRRILKLMKEGLIAKRKVYIEPKDVYIPTKKAVSVLRSEHMSFTLGISKDKTFATFNHDKRLIDIRILFKELGIRTWIPERVLRSFRPRGSCPDAFLTTQKAHYAIEYERTEKRLLRYKDIFRHYDDENKFSAVLYICHSESFISRVKKKHYPSRRFFFITLEKLFSERENATFFSFSDGLSVKRLIEESQDCDLNQIDPIRLEDFLKPKEVATAWKG